MRKKLWILLLLCYPIGMYAQKKARRDSTANTQKQQPIKNSAGGEDALTYVFSESQIDDDDKVTQNVSSLHGASDDVYLKTSGYSFSPMRFNVRGLNDEYAKTYINGVGFNDGERGTFNFSMLGGMNDLFKNRDVVNGLEAASFSFGNIGGATNILTNAGQMAAGGKASVAYTNRSYKTKASASYSTGMMQNGWAFTGAMIRRWADEGFVEGTFYNSWGYYLSATRRINASQTLSLTTFGAPTERGQQGASFQEAYDLSGSNYYNPNWGYQNGKKRNARVVKSYDPTVVLSHEWKIDKQTRLNTGVGARYNKYSSSSLNWYNSADPRPDYYRYLPSYMTDPALKQLYTDAWKNDINRRQINWDELYNINYRNNINNANNGTRNTTPYILEDRHNDQFEFTLNSTFNKTRSNNSKLTGGIEFRYTKGLHYKTIADLLGGEYWLDVDQFAERDFGSGNQAQNDMNNPDKVVKTGDKFGYDYNIHVYSGNVWGQYAVKLGKWELNYGAKLAYTNFFRDGKMKNGRAPLNSYGLGRNHRYITPAGKLSLQYNFNGRHALSANIGAGSVAPLANNAYLSPRIKDTEISGLKAEKYASADLNYNFSTRSVKGRVSLFQTNFWDQSELDNFYHDVYRTYVNHVMAGINKVNRGIEIGVSVKLNSSFTLSAAGTWADYRYLNNPKGTLSYENGSQPDTSQTIYIQNFKISSNPQKVGNLTLSYFHPKMWFVDLSCSYFADTYLDFSPLRRTVGAMPPAPVGWPDAVSETDLTAFNAKREEITRQEKLPNGFLVDLSVGKVLYLKNKKSLNFNLSVNNILNNLNLISGGFENGRFDYENRDINKFPPKYYYVQGTNLYFTTSYKF